jgi:positive regulator of sigma E activity
MIDSNHLEKAKEYSRIKSSRCFYLVHFFWAIHLAFLLFVWSILMVIHAVIPQLVGFYVIKKIVDYIKELKNKHPDDPLLNKINFTD